MLTAILLISLISSFANSAPTVVDAHQELRVEGARVLDSCGRPVQLRGMSYFWHQWENSAAYWNDKSVQWLVDDWKVTLVRGAMGVERAGGYLDDPETGLQTMRNLIEAAIKAGVYVTVDWHAHDIHLKEAKEFFTTIAKDYGHHPNVIYELFNEPDSGVLNRLDEKWPEIKEYSEELIATIRKYDPDNIIIVGTPFYSQHVHTAADDPITHDSNGKPVKNIVYSLHFYAGSTSHQRPLMEKASYAVERGLPLWVSECGRVATNFGPHNPINTQAFLNWERFLNENGISWSKWSMSKKHENSSSLKPSASIYGGWNPQRDLTEEGRWSRDFFRSRYKAPKACKK